ncbi:MAG TPA: serine/threonine-protein kinase, partial [Myxococcota bacterium]|nr:serine/threonine-protein kinase [Myxococcota bacterium]
MYSFEERYRPLRELPGRRRIFVAEDQLLTRQVVVKEVDRQGVLQRREVAALLRLELPGVVRLWDQERVGDRSYLILDYVEGDSFPGLGRADWEPLCMTTVALLRVLKRIHAAGVIHRDLKPEHVRLRGQEVVLIDFGAAAGPGTDAGGPKEEGGAGTWRYIAPEAIVDAESIGPNADLYALGVMLYEALGGVELHAGSDFRRRRLRGEQRPIEELRPDLPETAVHLLKGLLQTDPEERLPHAEAALELLGFPAPTEVEQVLAHWNGRSPTLEDLLGLFHGPERIFGKRSWGLALLRRRAPAPLRAAELSAWLAAGRAAWVDGALDLSTEDRAWLGELVPLYQPPPSPAPLQQRLEELLARIHLCWPGATAVEVGAEKEEVETLKRAGRVVEEEGRLWALRLPWAWEKTGSRERERLQGEAARGLGMGDPRRLRLLFSSAPAEVLLEELQETALERVMAGDVGGGLLRAELGLRLCRSLGVDEEALLKCWVNAALSESSPQMVRRALVECQRSVLPEERVASLKRLVQCADWTKGGQSGRALAALEGLRFEEEWLDRGGQGYTG